VDGRIGGPATAAAGGNTLVLGGGRERRSLSAALRGTPVLVLPGLGHWRPASLESAGVNQAARAAGSQTPLWRWRQGMHSAAGAASDSPLPACA